MPRCQRKTELHVEKRGGFIPTSYFCLSCNQNELQYTNTQIQLKTLTEKNSPFGIMCSNRSVSATLL